MKWLKRILLSLFAGFLILGAILQLDIVRSKVKNSLIEAIEANTGYDVEIEQIRLFPSFQVVASQVTVSEKGETLLALDHIHLGIYPLELLKEKLHFSTLHIEGVHLFKLPAAPAKKANPPGAAFKIAIDDFFIEKASWSLPGISPPKHPLSLKGSLIVDVKQRRVSSNFKASSLRDPEAWICGNLNYAKEKGSLSIKFDNHSHLEAAFFFDENNTLHLPYLTAEFSPFSMEGQLSLTKEGTLENTHFLVAAHDLAQATSLSGALRGEILASGKIYSPNLNLQLFSDQLSGYGQSIEQLQLQLTLSDQGRLSISFVKNEHPYAFSSLLTHDPHQSWLTSKLELHLALEEIAQLASWDVADIGGELLVTAQYEDQIFSYKIELADALFESFTLGSRFTDIQGTVEGDLVALKIIDFTAKDTDEGTYAGDGQVDLDAKNGFPFTFTLQLDQAKPFQSDIFRSTTSGELTFSGDQSKATLKGDLTSSHAELQIPEKLPEGRGNIQITYINQPEDESPPTQPTTFSFDLPIELDIHYAFSEGLAIKGGSLSSDWTGKIHIGGDLQKLKTKGELKLKEGRYILRGKAFEFEQGAINFNGDPADHTTLYLLAKMDLADFTAQIVLNGPLLNPMITLTSTPPMSQRAILSWLLFGRGISDINPMEETQLSQSLRSLLEKVSSQPDLLTRFGDVIGLDHVDIEANPEGEAGDLTVKVGKYVSDGTHLSISRNISRGKDANKDTSCFGIETKLGRHFRFRAEGDTETNGRLNLLWKNDY